MESCSSNPNINLNAPDFLCDLRLEPVQLGWRQEWIHQFVLRSDQCNLANGWLGVGIQTRSGASVLPEGLVQLHLVLHHMLLAGAGILPRGSGMLRVPVWCLAQCR